MSLRRTKVLFVCLGNACRSPMAEALARQDANDVIEASSAGLTPLGRLETMTKQTLARNGYSAEGLESKRVGPEALESADLIVNMSGYPKERAFDEHSKVEDWRVEDPYGADAELYQRIFEDIRRRIADLADRLRKGADNTKLSANIKGMGDAKH